MSAEMVVPWEQFLTTSIGAHRSEDDAADIWEFMPLRLSRRNGMGVFVINARFLRTEGQVHLSQGLTLISKDLDADAFKALSETAQRRIALDANRLLWDRSQSQIMVLAGLVGVALTRQVLPPEPTFRRPSSVEPIEE